MNQLKNENDIKALKTKLAATELKLLNTKRDANFILESTKSCFLSWSVKEGVSISSSFKDIFGYTPKSVISIEDFLKNIIDQDASLEILNKYRNFLDSNKNNLNLENIKCLHKDGKVIYVVFKVKVFSRDKDGKVSKVIASVTDVSYSVDKENDKKNITKDFEEFTYIISHDLNQPLRTIESFLEVLKEEFVDIKNESLDTYFYYMFDALEKLKNILSDLLEYSRIGRIKVSSSIDISNVVDTILVDFEALIKSKKVSIVTSNLPTITGYSKEIKSLFKNLISNSIKFQLPENKPVIEISCLEEKYFWLFSIKDNGIGIEAKQSEEVFKIFSRLHPVKDYEGNGVGLAFCKKIVALHNGKIWFTPNEKSGVTFYFTISKRVL